MAEGEVINFRTTLEITSRNMSQLKTMPLIEQMEIVEV